MEIAKHRLPSNLLCFQGLFEAVVTCIASPLSLWGVLLVALSLAIVIFQVLGLIYFPSCRIEWAVNGFWSGAIGFATGILVLRSSSRLRLMAIVTIALSSLAVSVCAGGLGHAIFETSSMHFLDKIESISNEIRKPLYYVVNYGVRMLLHYLAISVCIFVLVSVHKQKQRTKGRDNSPYYLIGGTLVMLGVLIMSLQVVTFFEPFTYFQPPYTGLWCSPFIIATGVLAIENSSILKRMAIACLVFSLLILIHQFIIMSLLGVTIMEQLKVFPLALKVTIFVVALRVLNIIVLLILSATATAVSIRLIYRLQRAGPDPSESPFPVQKGRFERNQIFGIDNAGTLVYPSEASHLPTKEEIAESSEDFAL